jgi:hypothetical protein
MTKMTRRSFTLLSTGGILAHAKFAPGAASFSAVQVGGEASGGAIFPYGAHVYREPHLPLEQLRHDLPLLKRLGFTMIKIQEVWGCMATKQLAA